MADGEMAAAVPPETVAVSSALPVWVIVLEPGGDPLATELADPSWCGVPRARWQTVGPVALVFMREQDAAQYRDRYEHGALVEARMVVA